VVIVSYDQYGKTKIKTLQRVFSHGHSIQNEGIQIDNQ
jgi:hypothetical protein